MSEFFLFCVAALQGEKTDIVVSEFPEVADCEIQGGFAVDVAGTDVVQMIGFSVDPDAGKRIILGQSLRLRIGKNEESANGARFISHIELFPDRFQMKPALFDFLKDCGEELGVVAVCIVCGEAEQDADAPSA